jgi:hypothetical protein
MRGFPTSRASSWTPHFCRAIPPIVGVSSPAEPRFRLRELNAAIAEQFFCQTISPNSRNYAPDRLRTRVRWCDANVVEMGTVRFFRHICLDRSKSSGPAAALGSAYRKTTDVRPWPRPPGHLAREPDRPAKGRNQNRAGIITAYGASTQSSIVGIVG